VLVNNWEATFFKFNQRSLLRLARRASRLGVELFVLDDGWFGKRNDDHAGLGDYSVNKKKLPRGLKFFAERIKKKGMLCGLWFEPEMENEDSDLFRAHPEYAVCTPGKNPALGRNQLVLDLCNPEVRDYIVNSVGRILDEADISYVKWDMNRHISDAYSPLLENQGEFFHRYIMGLYDVLERIFRPRPHILLESCASGGNRFDLGMLCYSPQVWASDDTDPIERLEIQGGLSYLYPLSTMGAHVSEAPHQQTLRDTPLTTRFNVSCFGCLGYELDLKYLTLVERKEIKEQIAFYKEHRKTFQYGTFSRLQAQKSNKVHWQCASVEGSEAVAGFFQAQANASEGYDFLPLAGFDPNSRYSVRTRPQSLFIKRFGGLVKHILPVSLNPGGLILRTIGRFYRLTDCVESYECSGGMLNLGLRLNNQFIGSYYNEHTRLLGDFGSNMYVIKKLN
jgi:alpha-galactosidase